MHSRLRAGLLLGAMATLGSPAMAGLPNGYGTLITSGITVTSDNAATAKVQNYGLNIGSQIAFSGLSGTYQLDDIRAFYVGFNSNVSSLAALNSTVSGADVIGGTNTIYNADNGSSYVGWAMTTGHGATGSLKPGDLLPSVNTGNIFTLNKPLGTNVPTQYGLDIAVTVGQNGIDPFGNGTGAGKISTGHVYFNSPPPAVPEANSAAGLLALCGVSAIGLRRRRRS